ncbi:hypothetical protein J4H86_20435 [Spiractinospora alimapuensis]|uniref:hypothetical protein n=1 Tax=Spiractinospora alimapuensis TaxID=2820884 RepID=UPI001F2FAEAA|nr:hypothetical protein [Spiractinospora alimapuensis]QVQ51171.1 hypothetical protein J4H86_20435 [Spiractinospora alimapuensis]
MDSSAAQVTELREITRRLEVDATDVDHRATLAFCRPALAVSLFETAPGRQAAPDVHTAFVLVLRKYTQNPHLFDDADGNSGSDGGER